MANQIAKCSICFTESSLIITCHGGQHIFCKACVTACLKSRITDDNAVIGLAEGLSCPLSDQCRSQFDFGLLQDIFKQSVAPRAGIDLAGDLKALAVNRAVRRSSRVNCPNEECSFFFIQSEQETFQELFFSCPKCEGNFCFTCKNRLSFQGFLDHICPPDKGVTDTDANMKLHEVLTEAIAVRCPSKQCRTTDRRRVLAVKEPGDCNVMQCGECHRFFCFICSCDLGTESQQAHQAFPHRNINEVKAPFCWLFNDEDEGQTDEMALQIRQFTAVSNYLSTLQISDDRKAALLLQNREVLGDLYLGLTRIKGMNKMRKCILM